MVEKQSLIPAAQYVRMSTDRQEYSIENQKQAIDGYATSRGYEIVETYVDAGKTGVVIRIRPGLRRLLCDVVEGKAQYHAVLVYDISRWGRFQDTDEAAHYEFICRRNGVQVHYCAEQFENDGTPSSSLLKALKRTMAGEYSRELGVKVYEGKKRLAQMGFRMGGLPGLGYRRKLVPQDGRRSRILKRGEYKSLTTDRVILVLGPKKEVACVRKIFKMALQGVRFVDIAISLNENGFRTSWGYQWNYESVYNVVRNPKYTGCNRWNRVTQRLHTKARYLPPEDWITKLSAFPKIVSQSTFDRVHKLMKARKLPVSREKLLAKLRHLLVRKKMLTTKIISRERSLPSTSTVARRCGDGHLLRVYQLVDYAPTRKTFKKNYFSMRTRKLRADLIRDLRCLFPGRITISRRYRKMRETLLIDNQLEVSLVAAKPFRSESGKTKWIVRIKDCERRLPTLIYRISEKFDKIEDMYLLPGIDSSVKEFRRLRRDDRLLETGKRLAMLAEFCDAAKAAARETQERM